MKAIKAISCLLIFYVSLDIGYSQKNIDFEINSSFGRFVPHREKISDLGCNTQRWIISFNKQTIGEKEWQRIYNYPSIGFAFAYQKFEEPILGSTYTLYAHYTHYFFKRNLSIQLADGITYVTNPYNKYQNPRNLALTTKFLNSICVKLQYKKKCILDNFGFQIGVVLSHYSNGRIVAPNLGLNSWLIQGGINYSLDKDVPNFIRHKNSTSINKENRCNFVVRGGFNEAIKDSDLKPFYTISLYGEKRLNKKQGVHLGMDFFQSYFLENWIKEQLKSNKYIKNTSDYKRLGIFVGHELFCDNVSFVTQLGYYLYNPSKYGGNFYQRLGMKYGFTSNIYFSIGVKTHWAISEGIEWGIGYKL